MKFKRTIYLACFLLILTLSFSSVLFARESNDMEVNAIENTIKEYFDARYFMESNLNTDGNLEKYFDVKNESSFKNLKNEKIYFEIIKGHREMQINDLRFKSYSYNLEYKDVKINGTTATVVLLENADIYFNSTPNVKSQMAGLEHTIKLVKADDKWLIEEDNYVNDLKITMDKLREGGKSLEEVKSSILKGSQDEVRMIRSKKVKVNNSNTSSLENNSQSESSIVASATLYYLNRSAGVTYARNWALSINPNWGNYESLGGDCTNFISQCLYAAGVPFDTSGYTWYWYSDSNRAPAWTGASQFKSYALNNNSSSTSNYGLYARTSQWGNVTISDIVQLGSTPYHSMFISGIVAPYDEITDYLICQHSTSVSGRLKDYPLSAKPDPKYYLEMVCYYK